MLGRLKTACWRLPLAVLISLQVSACGATRTHTTASSKAIARHVQREQPAPDYRKIDRDHDNDTEPAIGDDTNHDSVLNSGRPASAAERQAIDTLLRRYYRAAVSEDGAAACSMLYSTYAEGIPEDYGQSPPGPPYMHGTTCQAALTGMFKHFHAQLVAEAPQMRIAHIRLEHHHGVAILMFGQLPQRQITVAREGHIWKLNTLLDTELP